jgi:hypothetical protein
LRRAARSRAEGAAGPDAAVPSLWLRAGTTQQTIAVPRVGRVGARPLRDGVVTLAGFAKSYGSDDVLTCRPRPLPTPFRFELRLASGGASRSSRMSLLCLFHVFRNLSNVAPNVAPAAERIRGLDHFRSNPLTWLAPRDGFEPSTQRLTAACSTTELPGIRARPRKKRGMVPLWRPEAESNRCTRICSPGEYLFPGIPERTIFPFYLNPITGDPLSSDFPADPDFSWQDYTGITHDQEAPARRGRHIGYPPASSQGAVSRVRTRRHPLAGRSLGRLVVERGGLEMRFRSSSRVSDKLYPSAFLPISRHD